MKRYPEYKKSSVEWVGEIPAHWEIKKLKYIAMILPSNVDKHIYPDEIQVRLCNYTDVYYNDYITVNTVLKKGSCKESEFEKFVLRKGDVIITKDSETPDDIGVPTFIKDDLDNVVCGYHLTMIKPLSCHGEFIFRFIQSDRTRKYFEVNSNGITRYGLGKPSIENLLLPIPTHTEQTQIANFLNQKTEQIDELVRIKERQIELLQEQRTALINQAGTKGLDPNVEMKPTGVEWIGQIPKHWDIVKCNHLFERKHIKNTSGEINLSVYRDYGVIKRDSRDDNYNRISEDTSNYKLVEPGDFVFNKMKCWQGSLGISEYRGIVSPAYTVCKPKQHFFGKYFHHLLRSYSYIQEFNRLSYGIRTSQWELRFDDFKDIIVPYPSMIEQTQIANFLDQKTEQIDELIAAEQQKIQLLKEYRQSLISEAVSGKIDVRNEV